MAVSLEFNTPDTRSYNGNFEVAHPDRTFSGSFDVLTGNGPEYKGNARFGWSADESLLVQFNVGSRFAEAKDIWAIVKLNTPFDGWRANAINTGFYLYKNRLLTNGSLLWADNQNLALLLISDYENTDDELNCEFKLAFNSTVKDVPTASAHFKHTHNNRRIDTDLNLKHTPLDEKPNVISIKSAWRMDFDAHYSNITGSIGVRSPLEGYRTGALSTIFSLSDKKDVSGGIDFDWEEKKYTLVLEGHAKKLTDNMFMVNITTPIERFRNIVGRFGINEWEKHIVAEVRAPTGALGIELLCAVTMISDFHVKFNLETPVDAFQKVMVVGKMKPETIEFMGCWNKIQLGFVGVWRMNTYSDFEYSYKVYTPLENFTDNGFVAKFIKKDGFDMEISVKVAKYKV